MESCRCVSRKRWWLDFDAEPAAVASLRRATQAYLNAWGLSHLVDSAQLCVSELATNVIDHVGIGAPARLLLELKGRRLRIEVQDPQWSALPVLRIVEEDAEGGRGLEIIEALAACWGVQCQEAGKTTWVELDVGVRRSDERDADGPRLDMAEALLLFYRGDAAMQAPRSRLSLAIMEEAAVDMMTDLMHWLIVHGSDPDDVLDRAQMHFESERHDD